MRAAQRNCSCTYLYTQTGTLITLHAPYLCLCPFLTSARRKGVNWLWQALYLFLFRFLFGSRFGKLLLPSERASNSQSGQFHSHRLSDARVSARPKGGSKRLLVMVWMNEWHSYGCFQLEKLELQLETEPEPLHWPSLTRSISLSTVRFCCEGEYSL